MTEQRKAPVPSTAAKCPIGLDASPQICSAGTCDVCRATGATPSSHLEPDHIGREANARQHAVNAATGATPTPRTDAEYARRGWWRERVGNAVPIDFARQLERELVACGKELIATHGRWQDAAAQSRLDSPAFTVTAQEKAGDTVSPLESAGNRTSEMSASQATRTEQMSATDAPADAWLIDRSDGTKEVVLSPLTDDTFMDEGDEAWPLFRRVDGTGAEK